MTMSKIMDLVVEGLSLPFRSALHAQLVDVAAERTSLCRLQMCDLAMLALFRTNMLARMGV
jgi:hypothetical protein